MAVTTDEILARGKGPVQQQPTWADQPTVAGVPVVSSIVPPEVGRAIGAAKGSTQPPKTTEESTGVENVNYDVVTMQGAPNNPKNAREIVERGVVNVANPQAQHPQTVTDTEQTTAPESKKLSYVEMFQQMSPYKPPTPEELEKERKRQKREAIFAAIGEGISAMSNLYFTTQYAPNAFDPSRGMAASTKARFDQLKKEREQNQREYMEGFMRAMKWDADAARDERNWSHTIEREKVTDHYKEAADARAQAKADRDAAMAQLRMDLMQGKISQQEAAAEAKRIEADYAEAYWQSRINKNNYRRTIGSSSRGDGRRYYGSLPDKNGNSVAYYSKADYEAALNEPWRDINPDRTQTTTTTQGRKTKTTTRPKAKTSGEKAGEAKGGGSSGGGQKKKTNVKWK